MKPPKTKALFTFFPGISLPSTYRRCILDLYIPNTRYFNAMIRLFRRPCILAFLFLGMLSADRHPLHMSSATLIQTQKHAWVIQKTIFTDDLESAMEAQGYEPIRLSDVSQHQAKLESFLGARLLLFQGNKGLDGRPIAWTLDAPYQYSPESIKVTLRFTSRGGFTLFDTSLLADFPDQKNIYAVRHGSDGWSQHGLIDPDHPSIYIP